MSAIKASKVVRSVVIALFCLPWLGSSAAAQGRWNGVVTDLAGPGVCGGPAVGFDANGDGLAVWSTCGGIEWARFTRASGTWSGPQELSAASWAVPNLFVHARGHAILTWLVIDDSDFAVGAWASVYDADTATWTRAVEFSGDGRLAGGVVDNQGDAIVSWVESASAATVVKTAVYDGVAGVWTMAADIRVVGELSSTVLRLDSKDQAIVLGQTSAGVTGVARFLPSIGAWSDPVALAGQGWPNMATDSVGNSTVVWTRVDGDVARVQASHYSASSGIWSAPVGLAISAPGARHIYRPAVASDAAGNTIAVWEWFDGVQWTVQSATYNASSHSWAAIASVTLGPNAAGFPSFPAVRFDPFGNATVIWSDPSASSVETARRSADGSWSTVTLAPSGAHSPTLAVDPAGNVAVAWASNSVIQTTRWEAAPAAPTITSATSSNGTLTVFATTPPAPPWFANTNYEYSLDDGATWTTRSPASTTFPLVIGGLVNSVTQQLRLRGVNGAGEGLASAAVAVVPGLLPPANLTASILGDTVTLQWSTPAGGGTPTGYVLEGGLVPGDVRATVPIQGPAESFTFTAPSGTFFLRLYATMGAVRSLASNEIEIRVNLPAPTAWLWVKVVDPSGQCIESATIQVIGGQGVGPPMTQLPPCGAWDDGGIFFTDLIPGVEMTLLASAPGYEPQVSTVTPSLAQPVQSVIFGLWPIESVSTPN